MLGDVVPYKVEGEDRGAAPGTRRMIPGLYPEGATTHRQTSIDILGHIIHHSLGNACSLALSLIDHLVDKISQY